LDPDGSPAGPREPVVDPSVLTLDIDQTCEANLFQTHLTHLT